MNIIIVVREEINSTKIQFHCCGDQNIAVSNTGTYFGCFHILIMLPLFCLHQ